MAKSKKGLGKFIAFATIAGVVAAGISYFTKYKSFHKELEEDFHDFEDNDKNDSSEPADSTMSRNYVSLSPDKEEAADFIGDMADKVKETADTVNEKVSDALDSVKETVEKATDKAEDLTEEAKNTATTIIEDVIES